MYVYCIIDCGSEEDKNNVTDLSNLNGQWYVEENGKNMMLSIRYNKETNTGSYIAATYIDAWGTDKESEWKVIKDRTEFTLEESFWTSSGIGYKCLRATPVDLTGFYIRITGPVSYMNNYVYQSDLRFNHMTKSSDKPFNMHTH